MKKIYSFILLLSLSILILAQSPHGFNYQAIYRDVSGNIIPNDNVTVIISILQGAVDGTEVFTETHTGTTNDFGLINLVIGSVNTTDFPAIDWSNGPYYLKVNINGTAMGVTQLLSVPYALHAETVESITESQISDLGTYLETETDPSVPTGTQTGEMQYWNGTAWVTVAAGNEGQVLTFTGGVPAWKTEVGDNFVINFATGKIWMDRNLGASQVATSSTDADAYGDLYQWGRGTDGHESRTSSTTSTLSSSDTPGHGDFILAPDSPYDWRSSQNDNLWQGVSGTNNPCPSGYRLPTDAEWEAERTSWSSNNSAGAFASPLKLPVAGFRSYSNGSLGSVGSYGDYWSGTVDGIRSRVLYFGSSNAGMFSYGRAGGNSVRCIKD